MQKKNHLGRLMLGGAFLFLLPALASAEGLVSNGSSAGDQGGGNYVDGNQYDLSRTSSRAADRERGANVGDTTIPGYNPNTLRPAGDGLGRHVATDDLNMGNNSVQNVRAIVGTGNTIVTGLTMPVDPSDAANKFYVDEALLGLLQGVQNEITNTLNIFTADVLTASDGVQRVGTVFSADNTVVRTGGAQSIAGNKTFTSRLYLNSGHDRPLEVRATAAGGVAATFGSVGSGGTAMSLSAGAAGGDLISFRHGADSRGLLELAGSGIRLTGLELPSEGKDAANKAYVDSKVSEVMTIVNNTTIIPEATSMQTNTSFRWSSTANRNANLFSYSCYREDYVGNATSPTCVDYRHIPGVLDSVPTWTLLYSNKWTRTDLSFVLTAGSCHLSQFFDIGQRGHFRTVSVGPQATAMDRIYMADNLDSEIGYVAGTPFFGAGSITDGCSVHIRAYSTSPQDPSYTRSTSYTIGDFRVSTPAYPAWPADELP